MTVINFIDFKNKKLNSAPPILKAVKPTAAMDFPTLAQNCIDTVATQWAKAAKINKLNDHFVQTVPWANRGGDYLSDLNLISEIESKLKMEIFLRSPQDNYIGWSAGFRMGNNGIETAPIHFTENYARCFNVLLFLKIKHEMQKIK